MYGFCAFRPQLQLPVPFRNFRNGILCSAHAAWDQQGRPSSSSHAPMNEWRRPARESHLITPNSGEKKNRSQNKKPRTPFNRSGSERDGRWAASICSETATFCVGACVCLRRAAAMTHPDKRGARSGRAPPLPTVCSAVAASFCYETSEHTPLPLWFTLFLLIAQVLTPARMEPEQSWYICGVKESRSNESLSLFPLSLFLSLFLAELPNS